MKYSGATGSDPRGGRLPSAAAITPSQNARGRVFYDAECAFCRRSARRWSGFFARRGFDWVPLQTPGTPARLGVGEAELRREMKLLRADGSVAGGVDAWGELFRSVWWLWPVGAVLSVPGVHSLGALIYRWVARNRYCFGGRCTTAGGTRERSDHTRHRHSAFFELP
jgi:predicted DCC family thiol-disulfide oxidoreductase YuxK